MFRPFASAKQADNENFFRKTSMILDFFDILDASFAFKLLGILGFLLYTAGFAALQLQWIDGNSIAYSCASILAAMLVFANLTTDFNLASALIQIAWIIIGACGVARRLVKSPKAERIVGNDKVSGRQTHRVDVL